VLEVLTDFIEELRLGGVPISPQESIDAAGAVSEVSLQDKDALRAALLATLVKSAEHRAVFGAIFDLYFSPRQGARADRHIAVAGADGPASTALLTPEGSSDSAMISATELSAMLMTALSLGNEVALHEVARLAVNMYAGIEPGRPVGVSYYFYRTLRGLALDGALASLLSMAEDGKDDGQKELRTITDPLGKLGERLLSEEFQRRIALLRDLIEAEIRRILVAERGAGAVAASLRRTALADIDFMHATRDELSEIRRALMPLARSLAARLSRRRRHRRRGPLDFRATIRRSLSTGGVPIDLRFRPPRPSKPEIIVIADVSGSVAAFARFTLQLVYAIASQFSKVRSFVFVDGIDEVTGIFLHSTSISEALQRVHREADVSHQDGHSDYGHALSVFVHRWAKEITPRTNVIVLGDARNNYHHDRAIDLGDIKRRARRVYWLNPEPRAYWGSGDSIMERYAPFCDGVFECRNLRQLEAFVSSLT
jgi:uncharacterized protein with von Willebrand factor type A (vWA) domain